MSFASALFAAAALLVDPIQHKVQFTATSLAPSPKSPVEFFFVGPGSDRSYEALFMTECSLVELVAALERAGVPRGTPVDSARCRYWPMGVKLQLAPAPETFLEETRSEPWSSLIYTGGSRQADGALCAETEAPNAFFALYSCDQSPLQFEDPVDKSSCYGRFIAPTNRVPLGEKRTFTLTWNGQGLGAPIALELKPGAVATALAALKTAAATSRVEVLADFSPALSVAEAVAASRALAVLDGTAIKVNGLVEGRFFYRAFLPEEKWRDRQARLLQPVEIHLDPTPRYVLVDEDWSGPDPEPKLTARTVTKAEAVQAKTDTAFIYASAQTKLEVLYAIRRAFPKTVRNWYVFSE